MNASGLAHPVWPPAPAVSRTTPSTPASCARLTCRMLATSASTVRPASCNGPVTSRGDPTLVTTTSAPPRMTARRSPARRALLWCTTRLTPTGAATRPGGVSSATRTAMRRSQRPSSSESAALCAGKAPITPAAHAAATRSGPDTSVIGAAMTGTRRRSRHCSGSIKVPVLSSRGDGERGRVESGLPVRRGEDRQAELLVDGDVVPVGRLAGDLAGGVELVPRLAASGQGLAAGRHAAEVPQVLAGPLPHDGDGPRAVDAGHVDDVEHLEAVDAKAVARVGVGERSDPHPQLRLVGRGVMDVVDVPAVVVEQLVGEQADGRVRVAGDQGRPAAGVVGVVAHNGRVSSSGPWRIGSTGSDVNRGADPRRGHAPVRDRLAE